MRRHETTEPLEDSPSFTPKAFREFRARGYRTKQQVAAEQAIELALQKLRAIPDRCDPEIKHLERDYILLELLAVLAPEVAEVARQREC